MQEINLLNEAEVKAEQEQKDAEAEAIVFDPIISAIQTNLKRANRHERDSLINFYAFRHLYFVDGQGGFTSVTTFNSSMFEEFNGDLMASGSMKKAAREQTPYTGMTKQEILQQWEDNRNDASARGTVMHEEIEWFYNGYDTFSYLPIETLKTELRYFMQFYRNHSHLRAYRTEWFIYDLELKLAGSIDMIFYNEKTRTFNIFDWKRSKKIEYTFTYGKKYGHFPCAANIKATNVEKYTLQLNMYKYLLETHYGLTVTDMALVFMHPDFDGPQVVYAEDWSKTKMPAIIEFRRRCVREAGGKNPLPTTKEVLNLLREYPDTDPTTIPLFWDIASEQKFYGADDFNMKQVIPEYQAPANPPKSKKRNANVIMNDGEF